MTISYGDARSWTAAPLGMIGLRLQPTTRRLKASEVKALPS